MKTLSLFGCLLLMLSSITLSAADKLPFVGKFYFETHPASSGTGTPERNVEIKSNGDVYFSFSQTNQANGKVTKETYYAGKFKSILKCVFKKWNNETTYYKIEGKTISECTNDGKTIRSNECCSADETDETAQCDCKSNLN